jgi:anion-transporting  ArsA/GET3 family ATPase
MALPRLIFVTGKGGTGKSTIAAALALALARYRPVSLADLDRRLSAMRLLGASLDGANSAHINETLEVLALAPRTELEAFIGRIVPIRAVARRMLKSRTFGFVTAALPGLEAFLMLERLRLMADEAAKEDRFVVVDGPATGNAIELLSVARGIKQLAPFGTLNRLARGVEEFLTDASRCGVLITLMPEELALREALEAIATMREKLGLSCVAAALNCVPSALFTTAEMPKVRQLGAHAELAERRRASAEFASRARERLASIEVVELPMIFRRSLGRRELVELGRKLVSALL